jgi:hypothetical protein
MTDLNEDDTLLEATDEQLTELRDLGISESELEDLSFGEAEEWIAELRAMREDAGRIGRE